MNLEFSKPFLEKPVSESDAESVVTSNSLESAVKKMAKKDPFAIVADNVDYTGWNKPFAPTGISWIDSQDEIDFGTAILARRLGIQIHANPNILKSALAQTRVQSNITALNNNIAALASTYDLIEENYNAARDHVGFLGGVGRWLSEKTGGWLGLTASGKHFDNLNKKLVASYASALSNGGKPTNYMMEYASDVIKAKLNNRHKFFSALHAEKIGIGIELLNKLRMKQDMNIPLSQHETDLLKKLSADLVNFKGDNKSMFGAFVEPTEGLDLSRQ